MKLQYRYKEYIRFKWLLELYNDGKLIETLKIYVDELDEAEEKLLAEGYTYGYTKQEVAEAKKSYEEMLKNII